MASVESYQFFTLIRDSPKPVILLYDGYDCFYMEKFRSAFIGKVLECLPQIGSQNY